LICIKARRRVRAYTGGMENVLSFACVGRIRWRDLVLPKEHGSWSLAGEPLALSLLAAPSLPGALLAFATAAAFFARRPLRIAFRDAKPSRRHEAAIALGVCVAVALGFFAAAVAAGGVAWLAWLLPSLALGAIFVHFDLQNEGRAEAAEIAGAAAFAFLPAAFGALAGWSAWSSLAFGVAMCGRAVPTVMCVRAVLRAAKTGVRRDAPALVAAAVAVVAAVAVAHDGLAPWTLVALTAAFFLRTIALLVFPRPRVRGRTLGIVEAAAGAVFVAATAFAWSL
jgi:hypothetical protein